MKKFWVAALIRAGRTAAQAALSYMGTAMIMSEVKWIGCLSAAAFGAISSLLTAVAFGLPEVEASGGEGGGQK